jgi:pSer/pThr/pTyr-binding forkhead associated (FHA) protein
MQRSRMVLRVIEGSFKGVQYVFEEPSICLIGRGEDCDIHLPWDSGHGDVSRRHCLVEVTSTGIRVRDLGSLNGTFVNGKKIGQRPRNCSPEDTSSDSPPAHELRDGDEIQVGQTVLHVAIAVTGKQEAMPLLSEAASQTSRGP